MAELLEAHTFTGKPLVRELRLDAALPARSYMEQTPSTDAFTGYNSDGYWDLPMPIHTSLAREATDIVFYDDEGYEKVRDYLRSRGIRHVLLAGYCTDMCVKGTTCGYENLSQDFNLFLVGDATLATYPGSSTPRFATQVAVHNVALTQLVTQAGWVQDN